MKRAFSPVFSPGRCLRRFFALLALSGAVFFFPSAPEACAGQRPMTIDSDLVIPLKDMSPIAIFYPVQIDGNIAEFFAVKAPDNTIRVVVNACQACGPAGFTQERDNFVCSACGQKFHVSTVERRKGGCNPIPVGDNNKKIGPDSITLELKFLRMVTTSRFAKKKS